MTTPMTRPILRPTDHHKHDRTDDLWLVCLFSVSGLCAAAFVLFLTFHPNVGQLTAAAVEAEFPVALSASESAGSPPAPAQQIAERAAPSGKDRP